jgi:hypothetical protein
MSKHHCLLRCGMLVSSVQQIALCCFNACQHKCRPNTLTGAVYYRFLLTDLPVLLEDVPFHQRLHMWFMKARRGTELSQREPDFRSTVDWTWVPSQVACTITWPQSSGFLAVGTPDFDVFRADQWRWGGTASRERLSGDASITCNFLNSAHCLWEEVCKTGLTCMGTTHSNTLHR